MNLLVEIVHKNMRNQVQNYETLLCRFNSVLHYSLRLIGGSVQTRSLQILYVT